MIFCLSGSSDAGNPNLFSPPVKNFSYFLPPGRYPPSLISQKFTFEGRRSFGIKVTEISTAPPGSEIPRICPLSLFWNRGRICREPANYPDPRTISDLPDGE